MKLPTVSAGPPRPLGQMLIVTAGAAYWCRARGPVRKTHRGDVVWCPAGEKHWHGATSKMGMTHIAILGLAAGEYSGDDRAQRLSGKRNLKP